MTSTARDGKLHAGSPHVWIDAGNGAPAKPRRVARFGQAGWLLLAAVGLGLTALADNSRVTASTYIQNGLIAQWDGVDNAGTGTHDSAATAWIDRVGGRQFALFNTVWRNGKVLHFNGTSAYGFLSGTDTDDTFGQVASLGVFETALSVPQTVSKTILKSTANVALNVPGSLTSGIYFQFRNPATKTFQVAYNTPTTVAVVYTGSYDDELTVYGDGLPAAVGKADSVGGNAGGGTFLGCRNSGSGTTRERYFGGDIWSIRLYNRELSQEELRINAALDRVRFYGEAIDVNLILPTGWGVGDDGVLCHLYANGATLTTGQVFSDFGVEFAPSATVALSATPTAESAALRVVGKKIVVKGALTLTLPAETAPGTYVLAQAEEIVLAAGASVAVDHSRYGLRCTPTVTETDITVDVAFDTSMAPTAEWIGGSTGRADDPSCWICRSSSGEVLENSLPTAEMRVSLPDGCSANFPVGAAFTALEVSLPATLGADCDWSGIVAPFSGKLDLKGHRLTVSQLASTSAAEITDSNGGDYALLESIASQEDRQQYIDTGVVPKTPMVCEFDFEKLDDIFDTGVMGYRNTTARTNDNNFFPLSYYYGWSYSTGAMLTASSVRTGRRHFRSTFLNGFQELRDLDVGDVIRTSTGTPHSYDSGSLFLFGYSKAGVLGDPIQMRLYSCKMDDGQGTVFRHFVPARRLSDGAVGLLDLAHLGEANEFYANAGTGEFVSGPVTNALFHTGAAGGELHVAVAAGQTTENAAIALTGSATLVKEGAGTLMWSGDANSVATSVLVGVSNGVFAVSQEIAFTVLDVATGATFRASEEPTVVQVLSGGGTVTGAGFAFGGIGPRWTMTADDTGWTAKAALTEVDPAALSALATIDVVYAGTYATTLEIGPTLGVTAETLPALTVRSPADKLIASDLEIRDGKLVLEIARGVDEATWTGAAGDGDLSNPDNWSCADALGNPKEGELPDARSTVNFTGATLPDIPAGTTLAAKRVVFSGTLTADHDLSGMSAPIAGKLDLKGHNLTVSRLVAAGAAEITDSTSGKVYQLLDSITSQSDRKQYIDTGVVPKTPLVCEFDLEKLDNVADTGVMGYRNTSARTNNNNFFPLSYYNGWDYSTGAALPGNIVRTGRLNFRSTFLDGFQELRDLIVGDVLRTTTDIPHSYSSGSLFLFGYSKAGVLGDPIQMRLYSCKMDDGNGTVFRDFAPARRLSDGTVGLLDLAHLNTAKEFYENAGPGAFTAGSATGLLNFGPAGGELHVVCAGAITNESVALTGSLKLVKEGAGKFLAAKKGQTYLGGTEVKEGLLELFNDATGFSADEQVLGLPGSTVRIDANAELNLSGTKGMDAYPFELNGGCLGNWSFDGADYADAEIGQVTLLADSHLEVPLNLIVRRGTVDLGGHTLYLVAATDTRNGKGTTGYGWFYLDGACTMTNGVLEVTTFGGWFDNRSRVRDLRSVELKLRSAMQIESDIQVGNLELIYNSNYAGGDGKIFVNGVFTPTASNGYHRNCVLQDGATLNLAGKTEAWSVATSLSKCNNVTFATGATIAIIPPQRPNGKLVLTSDGIDPEVWESLHFVKASGVTGTLLKQPEGIYWERNFTIFLR